MGCGWSVGWQSTAALLNSHTSNSLLGVRHEFQHITVDAVTFAGRWRAVVENVAEVDAGAGAAHFDALHAVRNIGMLRNCAGQRTEKARPACATVELAVAAEQRRASNRVNKDPGAFFVEVRSRSRMLGSLFESGFVLCGGQ